MPRYHSGIDCIQYFINVPKRVFLKVLPLYSYKHNSLFYNILPERCAVVIFLVEIVLKLKSELILFMCLVKLHLKQFV